ncbi:MAG TPA: alkaline phosphatase family protein [Candidatus Binataceae bacterium]|nr:alkaline phosphatase family protein [Candidatus Binataceae bacterium]
MATDMSLIDTIVVLMMENRSFDHMLGYLSLAQYGGRADVNGLRDDPAWLDKVANNWQRQKYWPMPLREPRIPDPPHERADIARQMGARNAQGIFALDGFIASATGDSDVMNYQTPDQVPMLDFFAKNFRTCDRWFSCLPASTQPNRLMAMSGYSLIDGNKTVLPDQTLAYDWLDNHDVRWRVYHQGVFPFYAMMPSWAPYTFGSNFKSFEHFAIDFQLEPESTFPQVIFIEPVYTDAPHEGAEGTDDHSPSSVYGGQELMRQVYMAMAPTPRWKRSALIVTYDEHGGFFDHAQPLAIETTAPGDRYPVFETSGLRVPGIIVSPLVTAGTCCHSNFDHTSILKLLGEKFGRGSGYSPEVDRRNVKSLSDALELSSPRTDLPAPPDPATFPKLIASVPSPIPNSGPDVDAFNRVLSDAQTNNPHALAGKFPALRNFLGV